LVNAKKLLAKSTIEGREKVEDGDDHDWLAEARVDSGNSNDNIDKKG